MTSRFQRLEKLIRKRVMNEMMMKRQIAVRMRSIFMLMLSSRSYEGKLLFDYDAETLDIQVSLVDSRRGKTKFQSDYTQE